MALKERRNVRIVVFVVESGRQEQQRVDIECIEETARREDWAWIVERILDYDGGRCCSRKCSRRSRIGSHSSTRLRSRDNGSGTRQEILQ